MNYSSSNNTRSSSSSSSSSSSIINDPQAVLVFRKLDLIGPNWTEIGPNWTDLIGPNWTIRGTLDHKGYRIYLVPWGVASEATPQSTVPWRTSIHEWL